MPARFVARNLEVGGRGDDEHGVACTGEEQLVVDHADPAADVEHRRARCERGADEGIPATDVAAFEVALGDAGVEHRIVTYPGAPHSFFDRKADQFAAESEAAWGEVQAFIGRHAAPA